MGRKRTQRSIGALLMGIGLLLILSVAGYFAWTEVQAGQVRGDLEQGAAVAAARATRMAQEVARAAPTAPEVVALRNARATPTSAAPAATATPTSILAVMTNTPARRSTSTTRPATAAPRASSADTSIDVPTSAPTATSAPVLPVRLAIPDLKIDTQVVEMGWQTVQTKSGPVSDWVIPKNVAGHHMNSASIGQPDNLVISGHNNIYGRVFMPISQAWDNDHRTKVDNFTDKSDVLDGREVMLYDAAGNQHKYVITDFFRLKDTGVSQKQRVANGRFIQPTGDERVTIVTCWPPTNNTHRLVVIARPER